MITAEDVRAAQERFRNLPPSAQMGARAALLRVISDTTNLRTSQPDAQTPFQIAYSAALDSVNEVLENLLELAS